MAGLILRADKGVELTHNEVDNNFSYLDSKINSFPDFGYSLNSIGVSGDLPLSGVFEDLIPVLAISFDMVALNNLLDIIDTNIPLFYLEVEYAHFSQSQSDGTPIFHKYDEKFNIAVYGYFGKSGTSLYISSYNNSYNLLTDENGDFYALDIYNELNSYGNVKIITYADEDDWCFTGTCKILETGRTDIGYPIKDIITLIETKILTRSIEG